MIKGQSFVLFGMLESSSSVPFLCSYVMNLFLSGFKGLAVAAPRANVRGKSHKH